MKIKGEKEQQVAKKDESVPSPLCQTTYFTRYLPTVAALLIFYKPEDGWRWWCARYCATDVISCQGGQCSLHYQGSDSTFSPTMINTFLQDFDSKDGSDCLGFQVEAITILETEHSYVNILLGDYNIPEVKNISWFCQAQSQHQSNYL